MAVLPTWIDGHSLLAILLNTKLIRTADSHSCAVTRPVVSHLPVLTSGFDSFQGGYVDFVCHILFGMFRSAKLQIFPDNAKYYFALDSQ